MPFNELNRGDPFQGDFPGRTGHETWDELEAALQRQVSELLQRRHAPAIRHGLLRSLQQRRQGAGPQDAVTQFDFLPVEAGFDTLLARGELLITGQSYDGRHAPVGGWGSDRYARGYLDALGMTADELSGTGLEGRVLRLTHPDMSPQELADTARSLRSRGFTAALSNMTPTAPVIKAMGGPKTARSPGPFRTEDCPEPPARVAIIDTGIADQRRTDGWLADVHGSTDPLDTCPYPGGDGYLDFDAGHGTFIAGIIQQIAPGARITAYRAVQGDGLGSEVTVARELIRAVTQDGAQIVNLSLGCQTHDNVPPIAIQAALEIITEWERETGNEVVIVAAAGNYGDTTPCWPAAFRRVVSAAGLASDLRPVPWSSSGFWVTCSTIAQGLRSTFVQGTEPPLAGSPPESFGADAWAAWSGTSFAAAQVTGALARLHEQNGYPPREAIGRLLAAGQPVPDFGQAVRILPGA